MKYTENTFDILEKYVDEHIDEILFDIHKGFTIFDMTVSFSNKL